MITYVPIIKTSDAEIRALENLSDKVKSSITPLLELTRSRTSKKMPEGDIRRRLQKLADFYADHEFILDLTTLPDLSNSQIKKLQSNENGYKSWVKFTKDILTYFPKMLPIIQINDEGVNDIEDHYQRLKTQVSELCKNFEFIVYRFPLVYEDYVEDLNEILEATDAKRIICVIDAEFIAQEKATSYVPTIIDCIEKLNAIGIEQAVLTSTSFPKNPIEFGEDEKGNYALEERRLYDLVLQQCPPLIYGDYATINPIRDVQAGGNGWVPRIDLPVNDRLIYFRDRRIKEFEETYAPAYTRVAKKVVSHPSFKNAKGNSGECWGIKQIQLAAEGNPQGLSPSFWISVRMNIHLSSFAKA